MSSPGLAIVAGAVANKAGNGGESWVRLTWALGLRRLGFEVHFVEQIDLRHCVDAAGVRTSFEQSINLAYFARVTDAFQLTGSASLICSDTGESFGAPLAEIRDLARNADLLLNISGHLRIEELRDGPRQRVYLDLDPGFTQFWESSGEFDLGLEAHDHHLTVGTNIGARDCPIPTGAQQWRRVLPPVLIDEWLSEMPPDSPHRFTTIASWRGPFGRVEREGRSYGLKVHEFRKAWDLPRRAPARFELALAIDPADGPDRLALGKRGWRIVDPRRVAASPEAYRSYIQGSAAEFSVAQGIYVETRSGWFSDRTAAYLAAGRPALVQDTGIGSELPIGHGLLTFRTFEQAIAGVREIERNYLAHSQAARELAEAHLDADRVIGSVLDGLPLGSTK